jgi:DNA-directed RNA polymerase subunit RPC12/RpoP
MKQILSELDRVLTDAAADACAKEQIDFFSLDARAQRGLMYYWCSTCNRIHPLTDLFILPRRIKCRHCDEPVRLYSNSNKFGKLRRVVLYKLIDMGHFKKNEKELN